MAALRSALGPGPSTSTVQLLRLDTVEGGGTTAASEGVVNRQSTGSAGIGQDASPQETDGLLGGGSGAPCSKIKGVMPEPCRTQSAGVLGARRSVD